MKTNVVPLPVATHDERGAGTEVSWPLLHTLPTPHCSENSLAEFGSASVGQKGAEGCGASADGNHLFEHKHSDNPLHHFFCE